MLERRIQRLEAELESHDDEAKRSLRAMEQQFHRIKVQLKSGLGAELTSIVSHLNNTVPNFVTREQTQDPKLIPSKRRMLVDFHPARMGRFVPKWSCS